MYEFQYRMGYNKIFQKLVVIVLSSNKLWKLGLTNSIEVVVQKMLQWIGPAMRQWNFGKYM